MHARSSRFASPLALAALLLCGGGFLAAGAPAAAQCLSQGECDAIKAQLKEFRQEARADREEMHKLRRQIQVLPKGSSERRALRQQARALRQERRERRQEARPLRESFRQGCKSC